MRSYRALGSYRMDATATGDRRPEAVVDVRITPAERRRLTWLAASIRATKPARRAARMRAGMVRILGREVVEMLESGRRAGESVEVRLIVHRERGGQ